MCFEFGATLQIGAAAEHPRVPCALPRECVMKAVRFYAYGGPEVLRYDEVDQPRPSAGEVLVRVAATSFNQVDAAIRAGYLQQVLPVTLPHTPGIDLAGTVEAYADDVAGWANGDQVIGLLPITAAGAAAEFVVAPAPVLTGAPRRTPLADAASLPTAALTAWQALFEHADVHAGQRVLVNGAGGGVGGYAVQLAKAAGAVVIATASQRSRDSVQSFGADQIVDYTATRLGDANVEPVDALLNLVVASESELAGLSGLVRPGGVVVSTTSSTVDDASRDVRGVRMFVRSDVDQLAAIVKRIDAGELRLNISDRYPLSDISLVHQLGDRGQFHGKVVLVPAA
jgi:NADPH:quinone reductase-like Zn-dependent oxidoreductase